MDNFITNRKLERDKTDIEYSRLRDEEAANLDQDDMGRYSRGCCSILRSRLRSKLKYLLVPTLLVIVALYFTAHLWWPKPAAIIWSDNMRYTIYSKSNSRLVDRFVHLDLKGAPPRVEYLQQLFPLFKLWGATGLLIEWEDTFPYHDSLELLRQGNAYDDKQTKTILDSARSVGLKVVPLVQTFGHMEWVLKQQQFTNVREVTRYPQVICPTNNESLALVKKLIDDIAKTHAGSIDTIHIGADEAYNVATECKRCQKRLKELGALDRLMLEYVSQVARYAKEKHGLRVMMWYDMFEKSTIEVLRQYDMHRLVEPVIWGYAEYLFKPKYFDQSAFGRFGEVFNRLWIASAFKGANSPDQPFVDLRRYAQNHLAQLKSVGGVILTGWQRFDHFAMLCELLPPALPSLVFNLQVIKNGGMKPELFDTTRKMLNCEVPTNWTDDAPEWQLIVERFVNNTNIKIRRPRPPALGTLRCDFPGSDVYALIERLRLVKFEYDAFMNSSVKRGWFNDYNLHHQYSSIYFAEVSYNMTELLLYHFSDLGHRLEEALGKIFYDDTVTEWLYENVQLPVNELRKLNLAIVQIKQTVAFRNRPLAHMKLDL